MPTLSLITGVFVMDIRGATDREKKVDRFLYRLALILSVAYLFVVLLFIILHPYSEWMAIRFLNESNLWIAPLQGLVGALLGAFFVKKEPEAAPLSIILHLFASEGLVA
jgi:cytochrome bd-type quinol oxidase subunit 2